MKRKIWRRLLAAAAVTAAATGCALWLEPRQLTVRTARAEIPGITRPFRAVFFTDTHFGRLYSPARAERLVRVINDLEPDLVLFGGDLLDNYARDKELLDLEDLAGTLEEIRAPMGKFAVWGNHDHGGGASRVYEEILAAGGFQTLRNQNVLLEEYNLRLAGYDDLMAGQRDPQGYQLPEEPFTIALSHEPAVALSLTCPGGCWLFAGHTHGGQVGIPLLAEAVLPPGSGPFRKGRYSREDIGTGEPLEMYVSSGVGMTHLPLRIFNLPEVVAMDFIPGTPETEETDTPIAAKESYN